MVRLQPVGKVSLLMKFRSLNSTMVRLQHVYIPKLTSGATWGWSQFHYGSITTRNTLKNIITIKLCLNSTMVRLQLN